MTPDKGGKMSFTEFQGYDSWVSWKVKGSQTHHSHYRKLALLSLAWGSSLDLLQGGDIMKEGFAVERPVLMT